ncbi:hypothetical protein [Cellulomonas endophytica]|uniref:hypothetical protein n=1 Tax=Cellulomonas endophytica TaxID=2494735 RepID=UPI001010918A|nr:hypothetical protein [Cellulomonas endophytica]
MALDNPAARLHALLTRLQAAGSSTVSITGAWAAALGVEASAVPGRVAAAARLLDDLDRMIARSDGSNMRAMYLQYAPRWREAVLSRERGWGSPSDALIDAGSLATLGVVADFLAVEESEGIVPPAAEIDELRRSLAEAMDAVRDAHDLPPGVRGLFLHRLHDMLWALDNLDLTGPDAVKAVPERLAGLVALHPAIRRSPAVKTVMDTVGAAWQAFTPVGDAARA